MPRPIPLVLVLAAAGLAGAGRGKLVQADPTGASVQFASLLLARDEIRVSLYTLPGPGLAERVVALLDANRDGVLSPAEDHAYAARALRDVRITIDGKAATPRLIRANDSTPREIRGGAGSVEAVFYVDAPKRLGRHTLVWQNRHLPFVAKREFALLNDEDLGLVVLSKASRSDGSRATVVYELRKEPRVLDAALAPKSALRVVRRTTG